MVEPRALEVAAIVDSKKKEDLGQFLTPQPIADFMASLFTMAGESIRLLDAGAGAGALTAAFVRRLCSEKYQIGKISITAYEVDSAILGGLQRNIRECETACQRNKIRFSAAIKNEDFIEAAVALGRADLFSGAKMPFNVAILNPPYRKIKSDSRTRRLLREAGIETSNLYTGFLALTARLLVDDGEMVAICPRSFCNGPYFKPFRARFLEEMSLRRLHVFESRSAAFQADEVLQENIIIHAVKSPVRPDHVVVSTSSGASGATVSERSVAYNKVISPDDPEQFVHLTTRDSEETVRRKMERFQTALGQLGIAVSTGRVVDFRARQFLVAESGGDTAPLIYPCHFNGTYVHWPKHGGRKPNGIRDTEETSDLLIPGAVYVLVKRFTSKEERRRVVACIYDPERVRAERVGFENHLNYFHANGRGLPIILAKGLAIFLNSTIVDIYFRQFNGHTQVNATDLRSLRYPSRRELESLGQKLGDLLPDQLALDALIETEFF